MTACLVAGLFLLGLLGVVLWLWRMRRRFNVATLSGPLYELMERDRRAAMGVLIRREAHDKEEEEEQGDPEDPADARQD